MPLVLAAGEPGKEILYPVATVILGGLISSTLLDFFVHPALFWLFGLTEAQRVVSESKTDIDLVEESDEETAHRWRGNGSPTTATDRQLDRAGAHG